MIKFPKEVSKIMKTLMDGGFQAYATGGCVRDSLVGLHPYAWDIATSADLESLKELFPEAKIVSEKFSVVRLEFIEEKFDNQGEFIGEEGVIVDIATFRKGNAGDDEGTLDRAYFVDTIEKDLERRDFTINAMGDNGYKFIDPFGGREDIKKRLIKTVGYVEESFLQEPILMMRAIRFAAELDFDLHKDVYEAIKKNYRLLEKVSVDRLREEFVATISAAHGGKGLSMIMDTGIINIILGDEVVAHLSNREKSDLITLSKNIDRSMQVEARRLGLFYTCIAKKKVQPAIEKLNFDSETHQHLMDAIRDMPRLYFAAQPHELKKFIYDRGWDRYNYLASLEKAQRIVFEYHSDTKIKSKMYMINEFKQKNEPIFVEDLHIDGSDLLEAGICEGDDIGRMLSLLVEITHSKPQLNTRKELLALAKKYKKNKLAAWMKGYKWLN